MNISGLQYSKATTGLRQRDVIHDQKFKLVFAYPILTERGLEKYTESIRDFISISMLKEIFINNAINIVKMASQVHSLTDEKGNIYNTIDMVNAARFGNSYAQNRFHYNQFDPLSSAKSEISNKINEKTAIIKQLLNIDPKLKQLRPYVEIITMNNLIDVPVIVGTYLKDIDPKLLTLVLYVSCARDIPLVDSESVNRVFDGLKRTSNQELSLAIATALNDVDLKENQPYSKDTFFRDKIWYSLKDWLFVKNKETNDRTWFPDEGIKTLTKQNRHLDRDNKTRAKSARLAAIKSVVRDVHTPPEFADVFSILDGLKNNIAIDRNNMIEMVDKSRLMNILKYRGFEGAEDVTSDTITNQHNIISNNIKSHTDSLDHIKSNVNLHFNNMLSSRCYSYVMSTCYFLRNVNNRALDIEKTIKENFYTGDTNLLDSSKYFINNVLNRFNNVVIPKTPIKQLVDKLNTVNGIVLNSLKKGNDVIDDTLTPGLSIPLYFERNNTDVVTFLKRISEMGPKITSYYEGTIKILDHLFGDLHLTELRKDFEKVSDMIYNKIINDITEIGNIMVMRGDEIAAFKYGFIDYNSHGRDAIAKFRKDFVKYFRIMVSLQLLYATIIGLSEYIDIIKVDIETASSDVLDDLNYTIVMSSETASIVATLVNNRNFKNLMDNIREMRKNKNFSDVDLNSMKDTIKLNDNYTKGIVDFLNKKLKFPNVFIIDKPGNTIYYKLMYLSKIQKITLSGLDTYVSSALKTSINANNSSGSIYF